MGLTKESSSKVSLVIYPTTRRKAPLEGQSQLGLDNSWLTADMEQGLGLREMARSWGKRADVGKRGEGRMESLSLTHSLIQGDLLQTRLTR